MLLLASCLTALALGVEEQADAVGSGCAQDCDTSSDVSLLQSLPPKPRIIAELQSKVLTVAEAGHDPEEENEVEYDDDLETVTMARFELNSFLNRRFIEDRGNNISGRKTYWSSTRGHMGERYFLYFCKAQDRWMIAYEGALGDAQSGKQPCPFWARGPDGAGLGDEASSKEWDEWDQEKQAISKPKHAGIEFWRTVWEIEHINKDVHHRFNGQEETGLVVRDHWRGAIIAGVKQKSQAKKLGIGIGWFILRVDGEQFSMDRYQAAVDSGRNFTLSFGVHFNAFTADTLGGGQCGERFRALGVRDQGDNCNNCWAYATAEAAEWRLCKRSESDWKGGAAHLSVGYLTSCATPAFVGENGCLEGNMLSALRWLGEHGAPTGGTGDNMYTCVPNFANGALKAESTKRTRSVENQDVIEPPECPKSCTNEDYPRSLNADVFRLEGFTNSWQTVAFESATRAMSSHGPVLMNFPVYRSFLDYKGGVFSRPEGDEVLYHHVVLAVGYGPDYIVGVNSWGNAWGEDGYFRLDHGLAEYYVIPGEIKGRGEGYPYPLPDAPIIYSVFMEGFEVADFNDKFTEQKSKKVNGKTTLWNTLDTYFIYYCEYADAWAITSADHFEALEKDGSMCYWYAQQRQSMCQGHVSLTLKNCKWSQWDDEKGDLVKCDTCGVKRVSKE